jgi:Domain of Unknown Function (DUF930)
VRLRDQFFRLIAAEVARLRPAASKRRPSRGAAATFSPHLQRLSRRGIAPQGTAPLSEGGKTLRMRGLSAWAGLAGILLASILLGTPAGAQTGLDKRMQALEPHTRMIQLCNLSGLETFAKDKKVARVDRVRIDALAQPTVESNIARGAGGAVRTGGHWYKFSYRCVLTSDRMRATHFSYVLEREIPKAQWEKFNLF